MHPFSDWYSSKKEGYQRGVKSTRGRFFRRKSTHSFVRKTTRTLEKIDSWNQHYRRHMSKLFWTMIYIWQYAWYNQIQNMLENIDFLRIWEMVHSDEQADAELQGSPSSFLTRPHLKTTAIVDTSSFWKWYSLPNRSKVFGKRQCLVFPTW